MGRSLDEAQIDEAVEALAKFGTRQDAAFHLGISRQAIDRRLAKAADAGVDVDSIVKVRGRVEARARLKRPMPKRGEVRRYILTSAQNNTWVHVPVWQNLLALADHYGAEVIVGTFSYDKGAYGKKAVKRGTSSATDTDDLWYDPQLEPHFLDEPVQLAPGLVWCGEMNIIPTAPDPLSGLEAYNGRESNIVPHAKIALSCVASGKTEATKFNYSTGVCTLRNYIQKKTGLKAEREHGYGGLLVEVCHDGSWYVRQLEAAPDGSIRDFDLKASGGVVTDGNPVKAIHWGDVHVRQIDPEVRRLAWGDGGMLDVLRPEYQFLHDVIDFRSRNHHEAKDPLLTYEKWADGADGVEDEVREASDFLAFADRKFCESVVVPSNHHEAMLRWLKEAKWQEDPKNALFYHVAWVALLEAHGDRRFDLYEWASRRTGCPERVRFLRTDDSFVVCRSVDGGIEAGMHGHLGPNGRRGSGPVFASMGRRATVGHMHTASICRGVHVVGTSSSLDLGYNRGPSSWSHTHGVTYPEGTRTLVTMWKGRWRA